MTLSGAAELCQPSAHAYAPHPMPAHLKMIKQVLAHQLLLWPAVIFNHAKLLTLSQKFACFQVWSKISIRLTVVC